LASAALVGLFTVLNKWLLTESVPALVAGTWTYFAAGLTLLPWAIRARGFRFTRPWVVAGWLIAGSVAGPSLYFLGLQLTSGVQGVLMINTEAVFTALLAFAIFSEPLTAYTIGAGAAVLAGGIWLSWPDKSEQLWAGHTLGNLLIALGYFGWACENNLGRLLGADIPSVTLVCVKALAACVAMSVLALCFGQNLAVSWHVIPGILASGAIALGLSLALFYVAMVHIGAGRTGLISSSSTLWGVLAAIILLKDSRESFTLRVFGGGILMLIGLLGFAWETLRQKAHADDTQNRGAE
jgi:drug/metabolite transporter (DMT)-like permease